MLSKSDIEDTVTKFQGYRVNVTNYKDLANAKRGNFINSNKYFYLNLFLDLYIFVLENSLEWFDDSDDYSDDAPVTLDEVDAIINRGNELVVRLIELPLSL